MSRDASAVAQPRKHALGWWLWRGGAALGILSALYFATLLRPQTFFSWGREGSVMR